MGERKKEPQGVKPPKKFRDCNEWIPESEKCRILREMFCITRGRCSFYKQREDNEE